MLGLRDKDINISKEILSGIVIAIALVPEAIAFSFILGVNPLFGLYTSVIIGFVTSIFGGRAGMISAATGAIALVFAPLVKEQGVEYLFWAVILMGIFQIIFGFLNIGKLFRLISKPILLGFVNGLAIIIFISQLEQFKVPGTEEWLTGQDMLLMLFFTGLTLLLILIIPRFISSIPSSLIAIVITTVIAVILDTQGIHLNNVADLVLSGSAESAKSIATLNFNTFQLILIPAASAAIVGIVESLLTLNLLDELTDTRGNTKKEVIAQGIANISSGLFGGIGGCAVVGQSMINYNNGARKYLSSFAAAFTLLLFLLIGTQIIAMIPMAALTGVMFVVVFKTFAWDSLFLYKKSSYFDSFIVFLVAATTVLTENLAIGVISGIIVSVFRFTWNKTNNIFFYEETNGDELILKINGILFFGSENKFKEKIQNILIYNSDLKKLTLDFENSKIVDYSSTEVLLSLQERFKERNIKFELINLNDESIEHIRRATKKA